MIKLSVFFLTLILPTQVNSAVNLSLQEVREKFLLAEGLIHTGEDDLYFKQANAIKNYSLYPYLQYQWLAENLGETKKIKVFLKDYKKTRYAGLLAYKWKIYLAKNKNWTTFIKHYKATNNTKLQCHYYWAKYNVGAKSEALKGAKKLWVVGQSQPKECDSLFNTLKKSPHYTQTLIWQRFKAALSKRNISLAKYLKRAIDKKGQYKAGLWLKVHSSPSLVENTKFVKPQHSQSDWIFAHGIKLLARKDIVKAVRIWDTRKNQFIINNTIIDEVEKKLAMTLALDGNKTAYNRLNQLKKMDEKTKKWKVRAALRSLDWDQVQKSVTQLSSESQKKARWQYWLARSLEKTGHPKNANLIFTQLSKERSYYGYLSADKLNKTYQLVNHPVQVTNKMLDAFKKKIDFQVVAELVEVGKLDEAKRQWWYAVRKLNKNEILIAAKYAQQLHWKQESIFTIAKAKYWDDVPLRFPIAYEKQVHSNAKLQNLNPAVIYGLIRRESAFNENAQSPVGARGLMQIMPKTGQYIAKQLKEKWRNKSSLFNPETNLKYGAFYYKHLLDQFDGHYALAAAAYNAGPHRVKRWLPEESGIAADIWVETIPYKETRGYVSAVLTYALIYQKQLKKNTLTMDGFMREVLPG